MKRLSVYSRILDVGNGGPPFIDYPEFPIVSILMAACSATQLLVDEQYKKALERRNYYRNRQDEFVLQYWTEYISLGGVLKKEVKHYA